MLKAGDMREKADSGSHISRQPWRMQVESILYNQEPGRKFVGWGMVRYGQDRGCLVVNKRFFEDSVLLSKI